MPKEKPTVFIPVDCGHDFSMAEKYGTLKFITEGRINRFEVGSLFLAFVEAFEESKPQDYIVIAGTALHNLLAAASFAFIHGKLNLLLYRYKEGDYVVRHVDLENLLERKSDGTKG